ncbi:MAG: hypothetical protein MUF22_09610, partial [Chitinispirillaceae bacterium]|nr:hypothetical protein [Chitinispirillaceae bacterium]
MKRTPEIISAVLLLCLASSAVELNNWRLPYYRAAAEMGLITSSPSGMFWDDIPLSPLFDPLLAADSVLKNNHWWFEPDVSVGMQTPHESGERDINSRLGVLNDIRYGRFLVRQTLSVDSRYNDDPFYPAHRERVARGRIEEAYARVDGSYWFLRLRYHSERTSCDKATFCQALQAEGLPVTADYRAMPHTMDWFV